MNIAEMKALGMNAAQIAAMQNALNTAAKAAVGKITFKVSTKGAVSMYGFGRWPVTLYRSQAERLIEVIPELQAFIAANAAKLTVKGDATEA